MRTRRMVDAVPAAARGAALKADELGREPGVVEQLGAAAVKDRKQVTIKIALRLGGRDVVDPVNPKRSRGHSPAYLSPRTAAMP